MNIFYTSSSAFYKNNTPLYKDGLKSLIQQGNKVQDYVTETLEDVHAGKISEELFANAAKQQSKSIKDSDVIVADITDSSGAVGFHIASALAEKKPVLVLKKKSDKSGRIPGPIIGHKSKLLTFKEYLTDKERNEIINSFVTDAKKKLDTKFILIISPEIDRYLTWASQENRMHKAQIVRDAIEKIMKKDKAYKKFVEKS